MDSQVKVLLAEDEESFIDALVVGLGREGFDVVVARDGTEALRLFAETRPDLVLLDIMLPKLSGIDVCRTIRTHSSVPIIMVTAKGTEIDTVVGLEIGADDYVTKPYRLRELVARMRAVLRRAPADGQPTDAEASARSGAGSGHGSSGRQGALSASGSSSGTGGGRRSGRAPESEAMLDGENAVEAGRIRVDYGRRQVVVRGEEVTLRRKEFELLALLVENAGRVLTRDVLIDRVWGADYLGDTKTLDVHIKRLRSHIEENPKSPTLITTVRGVGYRLEGARTRP